MKPRPDPAAWGVVERYRDFSGRWVDASPETVEAVLDAMGAEDPAPPADDSVLVVRPGERPPLDGRVEIHTEQGTSLSVEERLPSDLPLGYHTVEARGAVKKLIVAPRRCYLPDELRGWGWAVQAYALRSKDSWGIGDLRDLAEAGRWARSLGASLMGINPLHAVAPVLPQQASPYSPTTRIYRNPLYLSIEEVPGAHRVSLADLAETARGLNSQRVIDRNEVFRLKYEALQRIWDGFRDDPSFDAFVREGGRPLESFAAYCALAEEYGGNRRGWPAGLETPGDQRTRQERGRRHDRVRFHAWLQWLIEEQLNRAAGEIPLVGDLAIGVDPDGAETWMWPGAFAGGVAIGAPPDRFNAIGQNWGLAPFHPHRLASVAFEPFIATLRSAFRGAGGLRIDHVMGLFRLFWIPEGADASEGTYVRYPFDALSAILALESHRAGAFVVGEDLGTVEAGVRKRLRSRNILAQRLLLFWKGPPGRYPRLSMAATTTHDLATVPGLWSRADMRAQEQMSRAPNLEELEATRERLAKLTGAGEETEASEVVRRAYEILAASPASVVLAMLEDALGVEERPNMPGTVTEWPNWSLALPNPLEDIREHPGPRAVSHALT